MSSDATEGLTPDQYGQLHPNETAELVESKLKAFEEEVKKLSDDDTKNLKEAQEKCPELLTDQFKLMFLRCEVFNADVSIQILWRVASKVEAGWPGVKRGTFHRFSHRFVSL